jgi:hypothetical protein
MMKPLISFVAFQLCWFACVGGAARGLPWLGPAAVAVFAAAHLRGTPKGRLRVAQAWLLGLAGAIGYAADSVLVLFGVLSFPPHAVLGWPAASWMVALWVAQAATLTGAMSWMAGRFGVGAAFGAVGGPLAYLAGERMGAAILGPTHLAAVLVVAVEWGLAMPLLLWIERRAGAGATSARLECADPLVP